MSLNKYQRGIPIEQPTNYGGGTKWQCWMITPSCFYGKDGIISHNQCKSTNTIKMLFNSYRGYKLSQRLVIKKKLT
jgi:hypothetical protein